MRKIVELKIEETKTVVGGTKVAAARRHVIHAPISVPLAATSVSGKFDTLAAGLI